MSPMQFDKLMSAIHKMYHTNGEQLLLFFINKNSKVELTRNQEIIVNSYGPIFTCSSNMFQNNDGIYIVNEADIKLNKIGVYNIEGDC